MPPWTPHNSVQRYPANVDYRGAAMFAALCTLGDAIEQQRHCGEDDNGTSMIGALHLGRRHRAGGLARDGRRGERAPQHVARRVLHQQHLLQRRRADGGDGLPCRAVPARRGVGRAGWLRGVVAPPIARHTSPSLTPRFPLGCLRRKAERARLFPNAAVEAAPLPERRGELLGWQRQMPRRRRLRLPSGG